MKNNTEPYVLELTDLNGYSWTHSTHFSSIEEAEEYFDDNINRLFITEEFATVHDADIYMWLETEKRYTYIKTIY